MSRLHVAHQRGLLGRGVVALAALVGLQTGVSSSVIVEAGSLGEGFTAELTLVGLVTCNIISLPTTTLTLQTFYDTLDHNHKQVDWLFFGNW